MEAAIYWGTLWAVLTFGIAIGLCLGRFGRANGSDADQIAPPIITVEPPFAFSQAACGPVDSRHYNPVEIRAHFAVIAGGRHD